MADFCTKCRKSKDGDPRPIKITSAVCDLKPMGGFQGPCYIKWTNGIIDHDDYPSGEAPIKNKKRS